MSKSSKGEQLVTGQEVHVFSSNNVIFTGEVLSVLNLGIVENCLGHLKYREKEGSVWRGWELALRPACRRTSTKLQTAQTYLLNRKRMLFLRVSSLLTTCLGSFTVLRDSTVEWNRKHLT